MSSEQLAIVTGASSGVGRAVVERLAGGGVAVISVDRDPLPHDLATVAHHEADLSSPDSVAELLETLGRDHDLREVNALCNIAGVPGTISTNTVFEVNLLALRRLCRELAPLMGPQASIVNVASISGNGWAQRLAEHRQVLALDDDAARQWFADRSTSVGTDPYSFSKEGVIVWSMLFAGELLGTGVRCNVVSPGPVETPLLPTFREQIGDERIDWVLSHAGRAAHPDEIAQGIVWLAVGESTWVNGHHLVVDGGYTSGLLSGWVDVDAAPAPKITHVD